MSDVFGRGLDGVVHQLAEKQDMHISWFEAFLEDEGKVRVDLLCGNFKTIIKFVKEPVTCLACLNS